MAQKSQADQKFRLYKYSEAIPLYMQYLEKSPGDYDATKNLALSYKYNNNINGSIDAYRSLLKLKETVPEDLYDFVQLLRIRSDTAEARVYALQYQEKNAGEKARNLLKSLDMHALFMSTVNEYNVINKTPQNPRSVFSPVFYKSGFIVTAEGEEGNKNDWTGRVFTKLFSTDATFNLLVPFAAEVMSKYNDGPATFSTDGNTMYYTTINKKTLLEQDVNTRKLQISMAQLKSGRWEVEDVLKLNNSKYNFAHPALRSDGKMLVFASDMAGGKGRMDLYYCLLQNDNTWSEPVNIALLNTSENELFPMFDALNNLFFASNGLPGLGGLDIFVTKNDGTSFSEPVNVKAPINSSFDDFALSTDNNLESGYLSTNRFASTETDDIAFFSRKAKAARTIVKITVLDKYTSIPLPYVAVSFKDNSNNVAFTGMTDPNGLLVVEELPPDNYKVQGILNEITTTTATITKDEFSKELIERTLFHNDPRFTLSGIAINASNSQPVEGVTVTCENTVLNKNRTQITKADGKFFFQLEQASDFKVTGEKKGWLSSEAAYETTKGLDRSKELYVKLKLNMTQPKLAGVIRLDKIYYDFDKSNINPRAAEELNRLVKLMNDYPDMTVELSSHTDSRGSDSYNMALSQRRADAAVAYIIKEGISRTRIIARGYGETRLVNECANGVNCSDAKHQENRRTEFKIISCPSCPEVLN
jgi:outer membrane protein OmpA-like peptidoglycan-associated protein